MVSSGSEAIRKITPADIDLKKALEDYDIHEKNLTWGNFTTGRFNKPVPITLHGRMEDGIKVSEFNGGKSYSFDLKLDVDDEDAFDWLEDQLTGVVEAENEKIMANGDFGSLWEVKPITNHEILAVKLKAAKGRFTSKINRNIDLKNAETTFIEPNQKVVIHGNIIWWVNAQIGKIGASFSLKDLKFE